MQPAYEEIVALSMEEAALERSAAYLQAQLSRFLKLKERVLICFPNHDRGSIGWLMEQAVRRCGAVPVLWGPEKTWKQLLQQAFCLPGTSLASQNLQMPVAADNRDI